MFGGLIAHTVLIPRPQVSYVLDTEDVFRRRGPRSGGMPKEVAAQKALRFQQWAASHLPPPVQAPYQPPPVASFA